MLFPKIDTEFGALIRSVVAVDPAHCVSGGHLGRGNLPIECFEAAEQSRIVDVVLSHMIEKIADVSQGQTVGALVFDVVDIL